MKLQLQKKPQEFTEPKVVHGVKPLNEREFDIVMFGVTGYTGGLCGKYLAKQYGTKIKWAIAGRRKEQLLKIRQDLIKLDPNLTNLSLIEADSFDEDSLIEMAKRTKVVISTVGPFQLYGTNLVKACISCGTNYCDITGETEWVKQLIENYDEIAKRNNCKIVNFCGHDCIPWDLSTLMISKNLPKDEKLKKIEIVDRFIGKPSGGTLYTVSVAVQSGQYHSTKFNFDPFLLSPMDSKTKSDYKTKFYPSILPRKTFEGNYGGFFPMAGVNYKVISRSNVLNQYSKNLEYVETTFNTSWGNALGEGILLGSVVPVFLLPDFLKFKLIPSPGEGPSDKDLVRGFLHLNCVGTGDKDSKVGFELFFDGDPGYLETAKMLVESGLSIALSPEKCKLNGILTAASCQGEVLLNRLVENAGVKYKLKSVL